MKKPIILLFLLAIASFTYARPITDTVKSPAKKDTVKTPAKAKPEFKADPHRVYTISLTFNELTNLVKTSAYGVIPYLETTTTPMSQLESAKAYFSALQVKINDQYAEQARADTLKFRADTALANKNKPKK